MKEEPKAEFQGFRLRRTVRDKDTSRQRAGESKYDFGVKLKVWLRVCVCYVCCVNHWEYAQLGTCGRAFQYRLTNTQS